MSKANRYPISSVLTTTTEQNGFHQDVPSIMLKRFYLLQDIHFIPTAATSCSRWLRTLLELTIFCSLPAALKCSGSFMGTLHRTRVVSVIWRRRSKNMV